MCAFARVAPALLFLTLAHGILPAAPVDTVGDAVDTNSTLRLTWYPFGSFQTPDLAYLSAATQPSGVDQGAFTRFSDAFASPTNDDFTTTPWIAYISCDLNPNLPNNATDDTFTLAKRRGAVAALLYSLNSTTCAIHPEFNVSLPALNMDIFATTSTDLAKLIEVQLSSQENATLYGFYNASIMNASAQDISQSITGHNARAPSYLLASLTSENASQGPSLPSDTLPTGTGEAATLRYSSSLLLGLFALCAACVSLI